MKVWALAGASIDTQWYCPPDVGALIYVLGDISAIGTKLRTWTQVLQALRTQKESQPRQL